MRVLRKGMVELLQIPFSPWSEKARWALERSGVAYRSRLYLPVLGELQLRRLLNRWRGPVTVPVLIDGTRVLADSFDIAKYANERGDGQLIPAADAARIAEYNELSERACSASRAVALQRMLEHPEALLEMLPKPLRRSRRLGILVAREGLKRTLRKYGALSDSLEHHEQQLAQVLDRLRADLAASPSTTEPRTLLSSFSYADIAMAQVLATVQPPAQGLRVGAATRRVLERSPLVARYQDLLAWRDALYATYRKSDLSRL
jgi:glutathione S-transferase